MKSCHHCNQKGHHIRECPNVVCHRCGKNGHMAMQCPLINRDASSSSGSSVGNKRRRVEPRAGLGPEGPHGTLVTEQGDIVCRECGERGHFLKNCPQRVCFHCNIKGHMMADCPNVTCHVCQEIGHFANACPRSTCPNCGKSGHSVSTCPYVQCFVCHELGHMSGSCSLAKQQNHLGQSDVDQSEQVDEQLIEMPVEIPIDLPLALLRGPGRVIVIIDGGYFEKAVGPQLGGKDHPYRRVCLALKHTLHFIGDIFGKAPFGYWFDSDPTEFAAFVEHHYAPRAKVDVLSNLEMRRRLLTDHMNGGKELPNVVAKLGGRMKCKRGFMGKNGEGTVWVQSGVDVAIASCVIECFLDTRHFHQVVLLTGDGDIYPCMQFCNTRRKSFPEASNPVRVCGVGGSMSQVYGERQDLTDFLPRILLDKPQHDENGKVFAWPLHNVFR